MQYWFLDTETRSPVDIKSSGGHAYAMHPETVILVIQIKSLQGNKLTWSADLPDSLMWEKIKEVLQHDIILAHNGEGFDFPLLERIFNIKIRNRIDTIDLWRPYISPNKVSLDSIAKEFGYEKNTDGKAFIHLMSNAKYGETKIPPFPEFAWKGMIKYCEDDVDLLITLTKLIPSQYQKEIIDITKKINRRGVRFDKKLAKKLQSVAEQAVTTILDFINMGVEKKEFKGKDFFRSLKVKSWLEKKLGYQLDRMDAKTLDEIESDDEEVNLVLMARKLISTKPEKKIDSMNKISKFGRIKDFLIFHGAHTGRYTSRGAQLHNLARGGSGIWEKLKDYNTITYEDITTLTRATLLPESGKVFYICDFAQIEARISVWLSGDIAKCEDYRNGVDFYKRLATKVFGVQKVSKLQRRVGKTAILGLGYGMGFDTFSERLENDVGELPEDVEAQEIINIFRDEYNKVAGVRVEGCTKDGVNFRKGGAWKTLDRAFKSLVSQGDTDWFSVSGVKLRKIRNDIELQLPSGRILYYRNIRFTFVNFDNLIYNIKKRSIGEVERRVLFFDKYNNIVEERIKKVDKMLESEMKLEGFRRTLTYGVGKEIFLHGGKIWENICQAIGADILNFSLKNLTKSGFDIAFHVHDEIICNISNEMQCKEIDDIMKIVPDWAKGLPLDCEGFFAPRYAKEEFPGTFTEALSMVPDEEIQFIDTPLSTERDTTYSYSNLLVHNYKWPKRIKIKDLNKFLSKMPLRFCVLILEGDEEAYSYEHRVISRGNGEQGKELKVESSVKGLGLVREGKFFTRHALAKDICSTLEDKSYKYIIFNSGTVDYIYEKPVLLDTFVEKCGIDFKDSGVAYIKLETPKGLVIINSLKSFNKLGVGAKIMIDSQMNFKTISFPVAQSDCVCPTCGKKLEKRRCINRECVETQYFTWKIPGMPRSVLRKLNVGCVLDLRGLYYNDIKLLVKSKKTIDRAYLRIEEILKNG